MEEGVGPLGRRCPSDLAHSQRWGFLNKDTDRTRPHAPQQRAETEFPSTEKEGVRGVPDARDPEGPDFLSLRFLQGCGVHTSWWPEARVHFTVTKRRFCGAKRPIQ